MTLKIEDPEHFARVVEFAITNKCYGKLMERLDYLSNYSDLRTVCHLHADFAPNSFAFAMMVNEALWFNGGLIYSGPGQPLNGSGPALTVGIGVDPSVHGWSVHT
jgi:hypothetical protein